MESNNKFDVFISYSRQDFDEVNAIKERIEAEIPEIKIWFDIDGIESGDEFEDKIIAAIDNSNIVLFALSSNSINSKWTKDEVMYARNVSKKIVPILLKGAQMKGWFLFKFGRVDCIDSTNALQMQKLISNLSSWSGKALKKEKEEKKEEIKSEPKSSPAPKPEPLATPKQTVEKETPESEPESTPTTPTTRNYTNPLIWTVSALVALIILIFAVKGCGGEEKTAEADYLSQADTIISANGISFGMIRVEGGTFQMGATPEQGSDACDSEKPVHKVTLNNYWIGQTEVTQELWQAVMGDNPSDVKGAKLPVENVSWDDCKDFIEKLNQLTGQKFRLPTEAEWEFAARGGNLSKGYKYSGSNTISDVAWCVENSDEETHEVATRQPNELGLYDMSGNVWEWCADRYGYYTSSTRTIPISGSARVNRGGSLFGMVRDCRVSYRNYFTPYSRACNVGLRLAL